MISVFFSYSHRDEALRDELQTHLTALQRQGLVETWHDRQIRAGQEWQRQISEHLEAADIILLLVSPDFIASDYCYGVELGRAVERHKLRDARVIPVILRPCDWQDLPFGRIQATPTDGKPVTQFPDLDTAFLEVTRAIKKAAQELGVGAPFQEQGSGSSIEKTSVTEEPRSSNLRLRRSFSDRDKDEFLVEAFEYISRFFENSLSELEARHAHIECTFRKDDAKSFTAAIYQGGQRVSRCRIWMRDRGSFPDGILYSTEDHWGGGVAYNEQLSVGEDGRLLYLTATLAGSADREKLTKQGAAEHLWAMLVQPLQ